MRGTSRGRARRMTEFIVGRERKRLVGCGERWLERGCGGELVGLLEAAIAIWTVGGESRLALNFWRFWG